MSLAVKSILNGVAISALGSILAFPAMAENLAFVIGNEKYSELASMRAAASTERHAEVLERAGFRVVHGENLDAARLQSEAAKFLAMVQGNDQEDRIVVVLAGHFVNSENDSWLLGRDAQDINSMNVGANGLSLAAVLDLMAQAPGQAVIMLADSDAEMDLTGGLEPGLGTYYIPQGVTVVRGGVQRMIRLLRGGLLEPGVSLADAIDRSGSELEVDGFVSDAVSLMSTKSVAVAETPKPEPVVRKPDTGELAYWAAAKDIDTIESMRNYLQRYPKGDFVREANARIAELRAAPELRAKAAEDALGLTRDQRRKIQRNLALLGFDPRGIDGLFGNGSRAAIGKWQTSAGAQSTGYLTRDQVTSLQNAANRRAAELEEEARQRREIEERQDRAYWQDTGRAGDETGLRAYMSRYPDGLYADVAQSRLDEIEARRRAELRESERAEWDQARSGDTIASYRSFLDANPQSSFAEAARQRIQELEGAEQNRDQIEADKRDESQIAGTSIARVLIEKQLDQYGMEPGPADGKFTRETRRAIRRFQGSQKLPVTGFVSQATMVRLMAGAFR